MTFAALKHGRAVGAGMGAATVRAGRGAGRAERSGCAGRAPGASGAAAEDAGPSQAVQ